MEAFLVVCLYDALNLWAQAPPKSTVQANPPLVPSAVVQLIAVGPGAGGQNEDCSATGFLINEDGYILTNSHVVEMSRKCLGQSPDGKWVARFPRHPAAEGRARESNAIGPAISCEVAGVDAVHDLAVLKLERLPQSDHDDPEVAYSLLSTKDPPIGADVRVTGHPASSWEALTQSGKITARKKVVILARTDESTEMLVLDVPLKRGSSGSPVYLDTGAVVAVVEAHYAGNSFQTLAVPIRFAIDLLNRLGVKWHAAPP